MANTQTIGIVEAVKKDGKGLLVDGKWYSNVYLNNTITAKKGDKVEVHLNEKGYLDFVVVLDTAPTQPKLTIEKDTANFRPNVDAGNCLSLATQLTIAYMNTVTGVPREDERSYLTNMNKQVLDLFKQNLQELS